MNAKNLHRRAMTWDWDADDYERLAALVTHPHCSLGTALLMYWGMCPHYYRQYRDRDAVPEYEKEQFDILHLIEERVAQHQYQHHGIAVDPSHDSHGVNLLLQGYPEIPKVRSLPEWMFIATTAEGVIAFDPQEIERQIELLPKREFPYSNFGQGLEELFADSEQEGAQ